MNRSYLNLLMSLILICACSPADKTTVAADHRPDLSYAKRFSIFDSGAVTRVDIYGDRSGQKITSSYLLARDTSGLSSLYPSIRIVKIPCRNIAALSSIYAAMLVELGALENIKAIDNIDYVTRKEIIEKHAAGGLRELARTPDIDLEQTLLLNPDIVFTYGMGYNTESDRNTLRKTEIPVAVSVDHLESLPLGRAEWIKFFGAFADRREKADSIFAEVERNYLMIADSARNFSERPTVFSETKYGDVWYMPGGKSYMALLLKDAGAEYLWAEDKEVGSLPLSFEQVYARAKEADFWINLPLVRSKDDLLRQDRRYGEFKAFRTGRIFNNTKVRNSLGYSDYWETGMIFPDRILSDLMAIFHTDSISAELHYYEKMN